MASDMHTGFRYNICTTTCMLEKAGQALVSCQHEAMAGHAHSHLRGKVAGHGPFV